MSPDIDSITSCWLIKRFFPQWEDAEIKFVPAGSTLDGKQVDSDPDIVHVDTGFGKFDHHQSDAYVCASSIIFNYIKENFTIKKAHSDALERMTNQIIRFDHFGEVYFPDPSADYFEFMLHKVIEGGLKSTLKDDLLITTTVFSFLDAIFNIFIKKNNAEEELKKGFVFQSFYGKSIAISTKNEETTKLALKNGFALVAKKDPEKGYIRIKTLPDKKLNLKFLHDKILKYDKKGTWFLHASGNMLLNSSSKNPNFIPSPLSLKRLIEIIKSI